MYVQKLMLQLMLLLAVGAAAVMLAATPGLAQNDQTARVKPPKSYPIDPITGYPIPPNRKLVSNRAPAKVTVTRRSYLDPGTAQKYPLSEHYHDYAFPPDAASSVFYDPTDWKVNFHNRTPFPNCFDLPGFCK
jgi:hypothetical protein